MGHLRRHGAPSTRLPWCLFAALAACGTAADEPVPSDGGFDSGAPLDAGSPDASTDAYVYVLPCEPTDGTGCPTGQRCTLVPTGDFRSPWVVGCDDVNGSLAEGAPACNPGTPRADLCGPGLWCFGGREADGLFCRRLCHEDADCGPTTRRCLTYVAGPPPTGMCVDDCTPFAGECPGSHNCSGITADADGATFWVDCHVPGTTAVGQPCVGVDECVADAYCWGLECRALCDTRHACAMGSCEPIAGLPNGGGVCR